jgi:hypothetical protein
MLIGPNGSVPVFVTVTLVGPADAPEATAPKSIMVGERLRSPPVAVPVVYGVAAGEAVGGSVGLSVGDGVGDSVGTSVGGEVAVVAPGVWHRGRVSPAPQGRRVGASETVGAAEVSAVGTSEDSDVPAGATLTQPVRTAMAASTYSAAWRSRCLFGNSTAGIPLGSGS